MEPTQKPGRNKGWPALVTFGEGWHKKSHPLPATARQGFFWWEFDPTWHLLKFLSWTGLIWDLRPLPPRPLDGRRLDSCNGEAAA